MGIYKSKKYAKWNEVAEKEFLTARRDMGAKQTITNTRISEKAIRFIYQELFNKSLIGTVQNYKCQSESAVAANCQELYL